MLKRTLIAVGFLLLVTTGSLWWYFRPEKVASKPNETIAAVPINAVFIIETAHPKSLKQKLTIDNEFWEGLTGAATLASLNRQINSIDSLLLNDPKMNDYSDSITLFISAHPSELNNYDFLFTIDLPKNINENDIENIIKKGCENNTIKQRLYDETIIYTTALKSGLLNYAIKKNALLISFSTMLVEDAIRQLNINKSLLNLGSFERLLHTQSEGSDWHLYINTGRLPGYIEHFITNEKRTLLHSLRYFNDWIILDASVTKNAMSFSGFSTADDSINNFLSLFKHQTPQPVDMIKITPANTALLLHFGISDFKTFVRDYKKYLSGQHKIFDYSKSIEQLKRDYDLDINKHFLDLLDKEMALLLNSSLPNNSSGNYAVFRSSDSEQSFSILKNISDSIIKKQQIRDDFLIYRSYSIAHLPISKFLPIVLGTTFESVEENYFTRIKNYLVFANSIEDLKNFINDYENGKTMASNPTFNSLSDKYSSESNIFIYFSPRRLLPTIKNSLAGNYAKNLEINMPNLKNIESGLIQFSSTSSFFYTNAYFKYNSNQNELLEPVWETKLDSTLSTEPVPVINHRTGDKEIFVQDDANTIYLIDKSGAILWKRRLDEKIIGKVYQIDIRKNNKLQLIFNTSSKIYLIDRNGNNVDDFPIQLKSPATNGLSVFDYDNNKNYRIVLACEDRKLHNYSTNGDETKQWSSNTTSALVRSNVEHVSIDHKDYILTVDESGKIYVLDRRGDERIKINQKLNFTPENWVLLKDTSLQGTKLIFCDSIGKIVSINLADEKNETYLKEFETSPYFTFLAADNDNAPQYLFTEGQELSVYNRKNNLIYTYDFKESIGFPAKVFSLEDNQYTYGITLSKSNEIYMLNNAGSAIKGFPCFGSTPFSIVRFSAGETPLLVCGSQNKVIAYSLPFELK